MNSRKHLAWLLLLYYVVRDGMKFFGFLMVCIIEVSKGSYRTLRHAHTSPGLIANGIQLSMHSINWNTTGSRPKWLAQVYFRSIEPTYKSRTTPLHCLCGMWVVTNSPVKALTSMSRWGHTPTISVHCQPHTLRHPITTHPRSPALVPYIYIPTGF